MTTQTAPPALPIDVVSAASSFNVAADTPQQFGIDSLFARFAGFASLAAQREIEIPPWSVVLDAVVAHRATGGQHFDLLAGLR